MTASRPSVGYVSGGTDCDDADPRAWPGAREIWYDGADEGCDVGDDFDRDLDGMPSATQPDVHGHVGADCDDGNAAIHPGAMEICNAADDDCDGSVDEGLVRFVDRDGGGFGAGAPACRGGALIGGDCDDSAATIYPGAPERCDGTISSVGCDFDDPASGASNGREDVWSGTGRYDFGADAAFTCSGDVCLEVSPP